MTTWDRVSWLAVMAAAGATIAAAAVVVSRGSRPERAPRPVSIPNEPITIRDSPILGSGQGPTLIVYSDFRCSYCRDFAQSTLGRLRAQHVDAGRLTIAFKHFALRGHTHAFRAGRAAECARVSGLFWPMHDELFRNSSELDEAGLARAAEGAGVEKRLFSACMSESGPGTVERDTEEAYRLGLYGTPTFFLGLAELDGRVRVSAVLVGAATYETIARKVNELSRRGR